MANLPMDSDAELVIDEHARSQSGLRAALGAWFGESLQGVRGLRRLGNGHINSTWFVATIDGDFVLQRLSSEVFSAPQKIMANLSLLLSVVADSDSFHYELPQPLASTAGELLVAIQDGEKLGYWRMCDYIAGARVVQNIASTAEARAAGQAFGDFQRTARTLAPETLEPVIDGFLELEVYWASLKESVDRTKGDEQASWDALWVELQRRVDRYRVQDACEASVIHGDCKVNNLLFADNSNAVVAILDLDTLMAGPWWLDLGDLVRSAAFGPDGPFRPEYYAKVVEGFFAGRGGLRAEELSDALQAPGHLSFMLTVRFLDDHLRDDKYFRVSARGDNLARAEAQFKKLCELESEACFAVMESSLRSCLMG